MHTRGRRLAAAISAAIRVQQRAGASGRDERANSLSSSNSPCVSVPLTVAPLFLRPPTFSPASPASLSRSLARSLHSPVASRSSRFALMSSVFDDLMGNKKEEPSMMEQFNKDCKLSRTTVRADNTSRRPHGRLGLDPAARDRESHRSFNLFAACCLAVCYASVCMDSVSSSPSAAFLPSSSVNTRVQQRQRATREEEESDACQEER